MNNNHDDNEYFTILFYKVIHNKYIFNIIIQFIHSIQWVEYSYIQNGVVEVESGYKNHTRFKYINSLKWMVEKKQYSLLKCKLEANEFIDIDLSKRGNIESLYYKSRYSKDWLIELFNIDKELATTILKLLLLSSSDRYILFNFQILNYNEELLQIALKEPYSIKVTPSILDKAIEYLDIPLVKLLLDSFFKLNNNNNQHHHNSSSSSSGNNNHHHHHHNSSSSSSNSSGNNKSLKRSRDTFENIDINNNNSSNDNNSNNTINNNNHNNNNSIIDKFKNNILQKIINIRNIFKRDRLLQFIFNNPQYYNIPTSPYQEFISTTTPLSYNNNDDSTFNNSLKNILFNTISIENQNQLLNLPYSIPDQLKEHQQQIKQIINNNNSNSNNNNNNNINDHNRIQQLIKLYRENVNNENFEIQSKCHRFRSLDDVKLIFDNNKNNWKQIKPFRYIDIPSHLFSQVIEYLITLKNNNNNNNSSSGNGSGSDSSGTKDRFIGCVIDSYITMYIERGINYSPFYKSIQSFTNLNIHPTISTWNELIKRTELKESRSFGRICESNEIAIVVKDKDTVDYIDSNKKSLKIQVNKIRIYFTTYELLEYAESKGIFERDSDDYLPLANSYYNLLQDAVESYDIDKVRYNAGLDLSSGLQFFKTRSQFKYPSIKQQITDTQLNQAKEIINYSITATYHGEECLYFSLNLLSVDSTIEIKDKDIGIWIKIYIYSLLRASIFRIKLFNNNNFNPIIQQTLLFIKELNNILGGQYEMFKLYCIAEIVQFKVEDPNNSLLLSKSYNRNPDDIIEIIQLILNNSSNNNNNNNGSESSTSTYSKALNITINKLFKLLLERTPSSPSSSPSFTSIEKILYAYQLINNSGIVQVNQNSTTHSIYYLAIKSMDIINYLYCINCPTEDEYKNFEPGSYIIDYISDLAEVNSLFSIDPKVFTFEYVFNKDTTIQDIIIQLLKIHLEHYYIENLSSSMQLLLNKTIEYLIDIKGSDLVLELFKLDILNQYLTNNNNDRLYCFKFTSRCFTSILNSCNDQLISFIFTLCKNIKQIHHGKHSLIDSNYWSSKILFNYYNEINEITPIHLNSIIDETIKSDSTSILLLKQFIQNQLINNNNNNDNNNNNSVDNNNNNKEYYIQSLSYLNSKLHNNK